MHRKDTARQYKNREFYLTQTTPSRELCQLEKAEDLLRTDGATHRPMYMFNTDWPRTTSPSRAETLCQNVYTQFRALMAMFSLTKARFVIGPQSNAVPLDLQRPSKRAK